MGLKATLTRQLSTDEGTFGDFVLTDDEGNVFQVKSLELPYRNNASGISCVKADDYPGVAMKYSPKHGKDVYHLPDKNGRFAVEFHSYNLAGDVQKGFVAEAEGCIALGQDIAVFLAGTPPAGARDQRGITDSAMTVMALEAFTEGQPFDLSIVYEG